MYWYLKAAAQGSVGAYVNIGYMYKHGQGVEKDYQAAFEWFTKAADAMTPLPGITWPLCITTEKEACGSSDRLSTCIVKLGSSGTRDVSQEIRGA